MTCGWRCLWLNRLGVRKASSPKSCCTRTQVENLGGYVRKGERATQIVYAATGRRVVVGPDDEQIEEEYRFLKWYWVFNAEQTEGISYEKPETKRPSQIIEEAEAFLSGIGAQVEMGGNRALYRPFADTIYLPHPRDFHSMADYYATNIHEHVHWTAHETRLNRPLVNRFGTEEYAFEELVAELGAAFLCSHLQIPSRLREDHAAYIGSWIKVLKQDKRAIFNASSLAAKAADYLREQAEEFALYETREIHEAGSGN
jgi:antirestriction protein ArdC